MFLNIKNTTNQNQMVYSHKNSIYQRSKFNVMNYDTNKLRKLSVIKWRQLPKAKRTIIEYKAKTDLPMRKSNFRRTKSVNLFKRSYTEYSDCKSLFQHCLSSCYLSIKKFYPNIKSILPWHLLTNMFTSSYYNVKKFITKGPRSQRKKTLTIRNNDKCKSTYKSVLLRTCINPNEKDHKIQKLKSSKSDTVTISKLRSFNKYESAIKSGLDSNILFNLPLFYKPSPNLNDENNQLSDDKSNLAVLNNIQSYVSLPPLFANINANDSWKRAEDDKTGSKSLIEISLQENNNAMDISFTEISIMETGSRNGFVKKQDQCLNKDRESKILIVKTNDTHLLSRNVEKAGENTSTEIVNYSTQILNSPKASNKNKRSVPNVKNNTKAKSRNAQKAIASTSNKIATACGTSSHNAKAPTKSKRAPNNTKSKSCKKLGKNNSGKNHACKITDNEDTSDEEMSYHSTDYYSDDEDSEYEESIDEDNLESDESEEDDSSSTCEDSETDS